MNTNKEQGVILVEAIVAIGVLVTIFTAAMALYTASVKGVRMTNDEVIATYLAQDGLEAVIAKRQLNYEHADSVSWLDGMDYCTNANPCLADALLDPADPLVSCGTDCQLYMDNGLYNTVSGDPTYFERSIEFDSINAFSARAIVRVTWMDGTNPHEYSLVYTMYDNPN